MLITTNTYIYVHMYIHMYIYIYYIHIYLYIHGERDTYTHIHIPRELETKQHCQASRKRLCHLGAAQKVWAATYYRVYVMNTRRLPCSSCSVMTNFLPRDYNILPKKELLLSLWVDPKGPSATWSCSLPPSVIA